MSLEQVPKFHIRCKREKTIVFLAVEATETVGAATKRLAKIVSREEGSVKLLFNNADLDATKTLKEAGLDNDVVVAMVYNEGGNWETPNFETLTMA